MSYSALTHALLLASAPLPLDGVAAAAPAVDAVQVTPRQPQAATDVGVPGVVLPSVAAPPVAAPAVAVPAVAGPASVEPPPSAAATLPAASAETPPSDPLSNDPPKDPPVDPNDIVVTARPRVPGDPLQEVNAKSFAITQAVDVAVIEPVARGYEKALPKPVRDGLRNFYNNLHEPIIALNFLLQLKPGKAVETLGRLVINSTLGVAGVFDFAKRRTFKLPRRRNGFANTLGYYGVGPGPFFFLPLIGSTTLRDLLGGTLDGFGLPFVIGAPFNKPAYTISTGISRGLDRRAQLDEQIKATRQASDPYTATREGYLKRRQAEIDRLHGRQGDDGTAVPSASMPPR